MPEKSVQMEKKYLYAVARGTLNDVQAWGAIGVDGEVVYPIVSGGIAIVASNISRSRLRPERRHIAAHQGVLKRLMETQTVLPMAFGIVAECAEDVEGLLARHQDDLLEQLAQLDGKLEMGLRIRWDVPNIFEYFVKTHPDLERARDRLFGIQREPTLDEKIEIGRMFERLLDEDREAHAQKVEEVLAPHCVALKRTAQRTEQEVLNLACLIEKDARAEFEAGVFEVARFFDSCFAFDYSGPWPPYNFVSIDLRSEAEQDSRSLACSS